VKLITLNTWGGRAGKEPLLDFFRKYKDVDVFCLQEISEILGDHQSYFRPLVLNDYGLQMLVKNNFTVKEEGELFIYKYKGFIAEEDIGDHGRPLQYVTLDLPKGPLTIINLHGAWIKGKNKVDTEERINQSKKIVEFVSGLPNGFILCGDFNLLPNTESMAVLEKAGMRNLIKEYSITSTRTSFYEGPEKYADYIFVSKGLEVKEFKVLPEEVSDHSALLLEI